MEEIEEIPLKTPPAKEDSELTVADVIKYNYSVFASCVSNNSFR